MRRIHRGTCLLSLLILCQASAAGLPDAGPKFFRSDAGVAPSGGRLPDRFDPSGGARWRVDLDPGHSTPILCDGKVFLTTCRSEAKELATVALDPETGKLLWRGPIAAARLEQTHSIGSPATATVACDGQRVFAFFGSYGLLCYDMEGKKLWEHPFGPFRDEYGAGSSPIVIDGKVILNQDHDIDSFLIALDCATGKTVWRVARPDAVRSYATPVVWRRNGHVELLVAGAIELVTYAPESGERLWSLSGLARIVIPTPVPAGDIIYVASWAPGGDAGRRFTLDPWGEAVAKWDKNHDGKLGKSEIDSAEVLDRFFRMDLDQDGVLDQKEWERHAAVFRRAQNAVLAVKPDGTGELNQSAVLWKHERGVPYVSTPVVDKGCLWMVKDGGIVTKLDIADGHLLQEERLAGLGSYYASPVSGDGKIFFASEAGVVSVVANTPGWQIISSSDFHEKIFATPAIHLDRIYIRTERALYCY